ncbi:hypothetical protein [Sphaerothrix gracilis]|uniref:hypothetical protein n=1 Tax=Sphaerothrix gracilis TaxID=3151835 RepID=UPI0031FD5B0D
MSSLQIPAIAFYLLTIRQNKPPHCHFRQKLSIYASKPAFFTFAPASSPPSPLSSPSPFPHSTKVGYPPRPNCLVNR